MKYGLFAALLFLLPISSQAYDVLDSTVTPLVGDAYLYELTYEFGYLNATATMPVLVGERTENQPQLTFDLGPNNGQFAAVVLSDAPVIDGFYQITPGERAEFTLIMVYRHGPTKIALPSLKVTELVHQVETKSSKRALRLDLEQLADYQVLPQLVSK